jgi:hypothetical protein
VTSKEFREGVTVKGLSANGRRSDIPLSASERDFVGTLLGWVWALGSGAATLMLLSVAQQESHSYTAEPPDISHSTPDGVTPSADAVG